MGAPMAARVVKAGFETYVTFHRRRDAADTLASMGATIVSTSADVAAAADVVVTVLPADSQLKEVALGGNGLLSGFTPGKVLVDMTTATAETLQEVERVLAGAGVRVLDAPVSGGTTAAAQGTLTIMAGGAPELLAECRPLLECMGTKIIYVGALGQGKVVKMVNQMMAALHLLAIGEGFALGMRCGADPMTLYSVIKESSGFSRMMDLRLRDFLLQGSFEPGFKLDLMKKDVNLALESARTQGIPLLLTSTVSQVFAAASTAGRGDEDFSAAAQFLADLANVRFSQTAERLEAGKVTA